LRVIQERSYKRIGSDVWQRADFRLVCATNRDLEVDVSERRFRLTSIIASLTVRFTCRRWDKCGKISFRSCGISGSYPLMGPTTLSSIPRWSMFF